MEGDHQDEERHQDEAAQGKHRLKLEDQKQFHLRNIVYEAVDERIQCKHSRPLKNMQNVQKYTKYTKYTKNVIQCKHSRPLKNNGIQLIKK